MLLLVGCKPPKGSVVELVTDAGNSGGTGFEVVAPSGRTYTLTNAHICSHQATFAVIDDGRKIPLRVIEINERVDLCLLEPIINHPALTLSRFAPQPGDELDVYGYGALLPLTHTHGEFVGDMPLITALIFGMTCIPQYTTVQILAGNSGSPVLNSSGDVVGVVFASGLSIGFRAIIVPLDAVYEFLRPY